MRQTKTKILIQPNNCRHRFNSAEIKVGTQSGGGTLCGTASSTTGACPWLKPGKYGNE